MREVRLTVGDYASPGQGDAPNPCVIGCAHLFLGSLFVLGEGQGGVEGGRVESRLAVSSVLANFRSSTASDPRQRLVDALQHANEVLHQRSRSGPAFSQAFAACAAVLVRRGRLYAARAGDIRLCVVRERHAVSLFDQGGSESCLGMEPNLEVQVLPEELAVRGGDRFVIGNGALFSSVPAAEMVRIGTTLVPAVAARRLVETAERGGAGHHVSVQVVQVGEPAVGDEVPSTAAADDDGGAAPFAPVPILQSAASREPPTNVLRPRQPSTELELGPPPRRRVVPVAIAVVAAVGLAVAFWPRDKGEPAVEEPPAGAPSQRPAGPTAVTPARPDTPQFWDRVGQAMKEGTATSQSIRALAGGPGEVEARVREARAVLAALAPVDAPAEPVAEAGTPDEAPVVEPEPERPLPPPQAWNPASLPTNMRGIDGIFSARDTAKAAKRLRAFIHTRHAHIERVLKLLDGYLELAPKERSVAVLELLPTTKPKPGPRTVDWAAAAVTRLKERLAAER